MTLKKFAVFAASVGGALVLFLTAAVISVTVSMYSESNHGSTISDTTDSADAVQNGATVNVTAVYYNEEKLLAAEVEICLSEGSAKAELVNTEAFHKALGQAKLLECANIDPKRQNFVILDEKIFSEIADRYGGLVYNESGVGEVLLTGHQANARLDGVSFSNFCEQIVENACRNDVRYLFSYLADNTVNNLSYPKFYNALNTQQRGNSN